MKFYINRSQFIKKQQTEKELDGNNFLVAYNVPIAKTGIQQYTREEIGDLSGDPDELVNVYRDRKVFKDKKLLETFDGIPIVYRHPDNGKIDNNNFKEFIVGTVSGVYYENGDLYAKKLTIIDEEAITNILNKETNELSIGFRGKVSKEKGIFEGEPYSFKEEVIHANHLALCENGKAGSYYAINSKKGKSKKMENHNPFMTKSVSQEHEHMKNSMHNLGEVPNFNIESIVEESVRKHMDAIKPINFGNEEDKEKKELHEEEEEKQNLLDSDDEEGNDDMMVDSDEEDKPHKKDEKSKLMNKKMKNKKEDEEDLENEESMDDDPEGEKKLKEIEKKDKIAEKHLKKEHAMEDSIDPKLIEADEKDRDVIDALKNSVKKLRNTINLKNKEIKNLELANISLQESLDEAKDYMTNMAKKLQQTNLMNSMAGPDIELSKNNAMTRDFSKQLTSAFLYVKNN